MFPIRKKSGLATAKFTPSKRLGENATKKQQPGNMPGCRFII
jgi:hypothetical protein